MLEEKCNNNKTAQLFSCRPSKTNLPSPVNSNYNHLKHNDVLALVEQSCSEQYPTRVLRYLVHVTGLSFRSSHLPLNGFQPHHSLIGWWLFIYCLFRDSVFEF